jgi:glutaredoxin-dependent peroxiredoxin
VPQFEALGAQVVGVSADRYETLAGWEKLNTVHYLLLSDFTRKMLPAYGAMVTDDQSPLYRYAKRAYFVIDRQGTVRWVKIQDNPLDLLQPDDVLKALRASSAS